MLLTSSLEQSDLKSSKHYIILHHNNQCDLVNLPETYPDLEKQVNSLYHIERERFHVETEELNLCRGKRVRIPKEAWGDISKLLGNVHIVPRSENKYTSPESAPQGTQSESPSSVVPGVIALNAPVREGCFLVFNIAEIDLRAKCTSSTKFSATLLDEAKKTVLVVSIFPGTHWILLKSPNDEARVARSIRDLFPSNTGHTIALLKDNNHFRVLCDFSFVGKIAAPTSVTKFVTFNYGVQSPFIGPISAAVYPDRRQLSAAFPLHQSFPVIDKDTLFHLILVSSPTDATYVSKTLASIRAEIMSLNCSDSGIQWQNYSDLKQGWNNVQWNMDPQSVVVIRVVNPPGPVPRKVSLIGFGPSTRHQFQAHIYYDKSLNFSCSVRGLASEIKTTGLLELPHAFDSPGEHSLAFFSLGGKLHMISDFSKSFIWNSTLAQKPSEMFFDVRDINNLQVDIYEFGGR